jgi:hypothetical protein
MARFHSALLMRQFLVIASAASRTYAIAVQSAIQRRSSARSHHFFGFDRFSAAFCSASALSLAFASAFMRCASSGQ